MDSTSPTRRRPRWRRLSLLVAVLLPAVLAPVSVDLNTGSIGVAEAACHDCRPAPSGWTCHHNDNQCPLNYEKCADLP